ncbi:hypothetical protein N7462_007753 [Penicillium macrosclerotiorum]|uniref:uncharacterized protein n=1 Tax=Penicillium macrosclerotiorum TaxID=303699 RepID=UPI0025472BD6|nr:uncharacterized protein N7462_007753 [Penicillium macrosclerotiorum]KAJ5679509.1 hypothetical protein N7462_007753 [Penicillium macrosclerotiorum]
MQLKTLTVLFLSTLAIAAPAPNATSDEATIISESNQHEVTTGTKADHSITSASGEITSVPARIQKEFVEALPSSVQEELKTNTEALDSVIAVYATSKEFVKTLDPNLKAYITAIEESAKSAEATATASGSSTSSKSGGDASSTASSSIPSASGSSTGTSTSTGGAPAATGGMAMGMAGAMGLLGMALAL